MAACLRESTARVYFSVWARPLCPRMLAMVLMLAPLLNKFVPQLWRTQCQVMCFWIPARASQWRRAFKHMAWLGTSKNIEDLGELEEPDSFRKSGCREVYRGKRAVRLGGCRCSWGSRCIPRIRGPVVGPSSASV